MMNCVQFFCNGVRKFLTPIVDQKQLALQRPWSPRRKDLLVNLLMPILPLLQLRLEVGLVDNTVGIAVDQPEFFQLNSLPFEVARIKATRFIALHHV